MGQSVFLCSIYVEFIKMMALFFPWSNRPGDDNRNGHNADDDWGRHDAPPFKRKLRWLLKGTRKHQCWKCSSNLKPGVKFLHESPLYYPHQNSVTYKIILALIIRLLGKIVIFNQKINWGILPCQNERTPDGKNLPVFKSETYLIDKSSMSREKAAF